MSGLQRAVAQVVIDDADEMGHRPRRLRCLACRLVFETDDSGLLREVDA